MRVHIPEAVKRNVRKAAQNRCGYCLSPQRLVLARLEIEHIVPLAKGGTNEEPNLWLACPICNRFKGDQTEAVYPTTGLLTPLFNPRTQKWHEHFAWINNGLNIHGRTSVGRATIMALHLNDDPDVLVVRSLWIQAGWHPPED